MAIFRGTKYLEDSEPAYRGASKTTPVAVAPKPVVAAPVAAPVAPFNFAGLNLAGLASLAAKPAAPAVVAPPPVVAPVPIPAGIPTEYSAKPINIDLAKYGLTQQDVARESLVSPYTAPPPVAAPAPAIVNPFAIGGGGSMSFLPDFSGLDFSGLNNPVGTTNKSWNEKWTEAQTQPHMFAGYSGFGESSPDALNTSANLPLAVWAGQGGKIGYQDFLKSTPGQQGAWLNAYNPEFVAGKYNLVGDEAWKDRRDLGKDMQERRTINPDGSLGEPRYIKDSGGFSDFISSLGPIVPLALSIAAPGIGSALGTALGGGLAGSIGAGALMGAGTSAITGGNVLKGALTGGIGAGIAPTIGGVTADLSPAVAGAVRGATQAGISGLVNGNLSLENIATAGLTSGVGAGITGLVNTAVKADPGGVTSIPEIDRALGTVAGRTAAGVVGSAATGRDVDLGNILAGAAAPAISSAVANRVTDLLPNATPDAVANIIEAATKGVVSSGITGRDIGDAINNEVIKAARNELKDAFKPDTTTALTGGYRPEDLEEGSFPDSNAELEKVLTTGKYDNDFDSYDLQNIVGPGANVGGTTLPRVVVSGEREVEEPQPPSNAPVVSLPPVTITGQRETAAPAPSPAPSPAPTPSPAPSPAPAPRPPPAPSPAPGPAPSPAPSPAPGPAPAPAPQDDMSLLLAALLGEKEESPYVSKRFDPRQPFDVNSLFTALGSRSTGQQDQYAQLLQMLGNRS